MHVPLPYIPHTKGMQVEVLLMNIFHVCGYVLYYGMFLHRRNHFSYDGTQLLKERAKTIRPGMILQIDDDDTTDDPPTTDAQNR